MALNIDAIVFDFDGVLAESVSVKGDAFYQLYQSDGIDIQKKVLEFHEDNGGVSRYDKIRHYEKEFCGRDFTEEGVQAIAQRFSDIVEQRVVQSEWVTGARDFLETHHASTPFYVASATPQDELRRIASNRNMLNFFKEICGTPDKKDQHINRILKTYNYNPQRVFMIGDAITDYNAAQKTGTHFIGRLLPDTPSPFPQGTVLINDLSDLENAIESKCP